MKPPKCRACGVGEWRHVCVGAVVDAVARVSNTVANADAARVRRWRMKKENRERYNAQQKERMRVRRAASRAST